MKGYSRTRMKSEFSVEILETHLVSQVLKSWLTGKTEK